MKNDDTKTNTPLTDNCKRCICHGCMDRKSNKFCIKHCDLCTNKTGSLSRKRCIYTPGVD